MPDEMFSNPRLVDIYDLLDGERNDLVFYLALAREFSASKVLDVGCGTGSFATLLAQEGFETFGVDPALGSLEFARNKPFADSVSWIHGFASDVSETGFDFATMTGNVSQAIFEPQAWNSTLTSIHQLLKSGGILAFESRVPSNKAWGKWNKTESYSVHDLESVGRVESWVEVFSVESPLVSFRWTFIFDDGQTLTSDSTLRFREREEVEADLISAGFAVDDVRDAPDRPGKEFVFIARCD